MKSLNCKQLEKLTREINNYINCNHIANISLINKTDILLSFSFYRKQKMLISLNHNSPFYGLVDSSISLPTILNKLNEELRKEIKDAFITDITSISGERIVFFTLRKTDEFYRKKEYFLVLELIPRNPNLIFLDEEYKIIFATHSTTLEAERIIIKNMKYNLPRKANSNIEFNDDLKGFYKDLEDYLSISLQQRNKEKYETLIKTINRKLKVSKKKIEVLNKEIDEAKERLIYKEYANSLYALKDDEYLSTYIKENNIPYDETKSLSDNCNVLFKQYKKAKDTIKYNEEQLKENDDYIKELESDLVSLENETDESMYLLLSSKYLNKSIPKHEVNKITPYYITVDGTKIGFGRNANQNNVLTFKKAKEDYYFFHLENIHGAHVVIIKNNPTDNDKENAAMLCLALDNKEAGTIQMAQIKNLKKGKVPGQVFFDTYTTIKINEVKSKIINNLQKAKRLTV